MIEDGGDEALELVLRVDADGVGAGSFTVVARDSKRAASGTETDTSYQISKIVQLSQGAFVDLRLLQVVGVVTNQDLFGSQANSYFSGYLVR